GLRSRSYALSAPGSSGGGRSVGAVAVSGDFGPSCAVVSGDTGAGQDEGGRHGTDCGNADGDQQRGGESTDERLLRGLQDTLAGGATELLGDRGRACQGLVYRLPGLAGQLSGLGQ